MKIEDSKYADKIIHKLHFDFGNFYCLENNILVSEIAEGITFNWKSALKVIEKSTTEFGENYRPHYISNRIYRYSIVPQDWLKFFRNRYFLQSFTVVTQQPMATTNQIFERMFYKRKIYQVKSLDEAMVKLNNIITINNLI